MTFLDCPAYLDAHGAGRCGLPAEVEYRYQAESTSGLVESVKIRCPKGHWFNGLVEALTWEKREGETRDLAGAADIQGLPSRLTTKPGAR